MSYGHLKVEDGNETIEEVPEDRQPVVNANRAGESEDATSRVDIAVSNNMNLRTIKRYIIFANQDADDDDNGNDSEVSEPPQDDMFDSNGQLKPLEDFL